MRSITVGTSGWAYPEWKQSIYEDVPQRRWLERYAEVFDAVEVNLTYRRDLTETTVARWVAATPPHFRFVIKAHQRATHFNRLTSPEIDVPAQVAQAEFVGERLGLIYFQLPHNFVRNDALLDAFLDQWPQSIPAAWEFLHSSWDHDTVRELLTAHGAAWVISDAKTPDPPFVTTSPHAYVRLRAESYEDEILRQRAASIRRLDADHTWVFVRHGAHAPGLAEKTRNILG